MSTDTTDQAARASMTASARQEVRDRGWTPDLLQRAAVALRELMAERRVGHEDRDLASELVRWLQRASDLESEGLVDILRSCQPIFPNAPQWDALCDLLDCDFTMEELVGRIHAGHADPAQTLIALLEDVTRCGISHPESPCSECPGLQHEPSRAHDAQERAFELLVALGTRKTLTYVMRRLDAFDWSEKPELRRSVEAHAPLIKSIVLELWPTLSWRGRSEIAMFLSDHSLVDDRILEFVTASPPVAPEDLKSYVQTLGDLYDSRVLPRITEALGHVLETYCQREAQDLLSIAIQQFVELDTELPQDLQQRATERGLRLEGMLVPLKRGQYNPLEPAEP